MYSQVNFRAKCSNQHLTNGFYLTLSMFKKLLKSKITLYFLNPVILYQNFMEKTIKQ